MFIRKHFFVGMLLLTCLSSFAQKGKRTEGSGQDSLPKGSNAGYRLYPVGSDSAHFNTEIAKKLGIEIATETEIEEVPVDSVELKKKQRRNKWRKKHSPLVATLASAIIPGAGQAYNRKYWKIPLALGLVGGTGYWMIGNLNTYNKYKEGYFLLDQYDITKNPERLTDFAQLFPNEIPSLNNIRSKRNLARDNYESSLIFFSLGYILQITDAFVDAHLTTFDVSDDLSMRVQPLIVPTPIGVVPAVGLCFKFK